MPGSGNSRATSRPRCSPTSAGRSSIRARCLAGSPRPTRRATRSSAPASIASITSPAVAPPPSRDTRSAGGPAADALRPSDSASPGGKPGASHPQLPRLAWEQAVERQGEPYTVDAEDGGGSWRAVARPFEVDGADGTARGTVVLASSLDEVDATVRRLVQIDVLVGLAVLGGLAVVGYLLVRTALRPPSGVEETAAASPGWPRFPGRGAGGAGGRGRTRPAAPPRTRSRRAAPRARRPPLRLRHVHDAGRRSTVASRRAAAREAPGHPSRAAGVVTAAWSSRMS